MVGRPALVLGQDELGQAFRVLHAHAAVAEGAARLVEQLALRRVVHVDVVLVGEHELDDTQHVVGAGRLDEGEAADVDLAPVHR